MTRPERALLAGVALLWLAFLTALAIPLAWPNDIATAADYPETQTAPQTGPVCQTGPVSVLPTTVTLTWYDGPGPNTACHKGFDPYTTPSVAAPPSMGLHCWDRVTICYRKLCYTVAVQDAMPQSSADRYGGLALDATPALMRLLGIPFGYTEDGAAYGRAQVQLYKEP